MSKFSSKIVFGENGRSIATYYTRSLEEMREYIEKGWSYEIDYKGKGFWLRAPDEWLVDLTDPFKINYYGNPIVNLAYYNYLKFYSSKNQLTEYINFVISGNKIYYKNFEFSIADGPVLQSEFRIIGSDNRLLTLKRDLFKSFTESPLFEKLMNDAKKSLGEINYLKANIISKKDYGPKVSKFYKDTNFYLSTIGSKTTESMKVIPNLIDQLPEFDVMLLIPNGCYKFINSLINEDNVDKVVLYEMHVNSHVNKCFTLFEKDLKGKRVLVVDQIYSGKTLQIMKDLIIQQGGEPITLGMFPKCRYALNYADYVAVLNAVVETSKIDYSNDWIFKLYKNILKKGE